MKKYRAVAAALAAGLAISAYAQPGDRTAIEVAPRTGDMAANQRPDIVQLKFITKDLGRRLATPDTINLDRQFSEVWSQRGVLSRSDLRHASRFISAFLEKK